MNEMISAPTVEGVLSRIRYRPAGYSPIEARIAAAILEDPDAFARVAIIDFAKRLAVSTGSVVRFAQVFGYGGFRDLKLAVAQELPPRPGQDPEAGTERSASRARMDEQVRALLFAAANLDHLVVTRVARRLAAARHVDIVATGASAAIAQGILFTLTTIGLHARYLVDPTEAAAAAALLGSDDVLLAISYSGRTRSIVDAAARARGAGASVLSLTCNPRSPLLAETEIALVIDARAGGFDGEWALRTALFAVARVLTLEVASQIPGSEIRQRRARWSSGRFQLRYEERQ
jgi:DNA-binding MurR/RpiR family transcriptional regulator